jgi:hypothetical protein
MAKKKRNPNVSQETLARARRELYGTTGPVTARRVTPPPAETPGATPAEPAAPRPAVKYERPAAAPVDLHTQYAYVVRDLRNMGTLAAIFMTVLVILSFVI